MLWLAGWQRVGATVFWFKMLPGVGNKSCRGQGIEFLQRIKHSREPVCACPGTEGSFSLTRLVQARVLFCALDLTTSIFVHISVAVTFQSLKCIIWFFSELPKISKLSIIRGCTLAGPAHCEATLTPLAVSETNVFSFLFHILGIFLFFIRDKNLTK